MSNNKQFSELETSILESGDEQLINDFHFLESELNNTSEETVMEIQKQEIIEEDNFSRFIQTLLRSISSIHMFHLTTDNFAHHIALQEYYENMPSAIDKSAEILSPYFGLKQEYDIDVYAESCPIDFLTRLRLYVVNSNFASRVEAAQSCIDDILNIIDICLYKLGRFDSKIEEKIRMFSIDPTMIQIKLDDELRDSVDEVAGYVGDLVDSWDQDNVDLTMFCGDDKNEFSIKPSRKDFSNRKYYLWINHEQASKAKAGNLKSQQGIIGPCDPDNVGKDNNLEYLEFDNKSDRDYYVSRYVETIVMDYGPGVHILEEELSKLKPRKVN